MSVASSGSRPQLGPLRRREDRVTPLELFFDLVFVLAITQCTAFMAAEPTWRGIGKALLILGVLWWSWVGYAWLTSVIDPEEDAVRLAIFAAMAALLVASLCIPEAFGDLGLTFAIAYAVVRVAHIALFLLASRDDPGLRSSAVTLAASTALGIALLTGASQLEGAAQVGLWAVALVLDMGGPFLFGAEGWELVPAHFAERHGLIVLIALGESIVAIGVGAESGVDKGILAAAVIGVVLAALLWWAYFDVVTYVAEDRLSHAAVGRQQNDLARDAYSYLHLPMVAGIVLVALGLKTTLAHVDDPLHDAPAAALLGGIALYLLGHVGFAWRATGALKGQRLVAAAAVVALLPVAPELSALGTLSTATVVVAVLVAYETIHFGDDRDRIRHGQGTSRRPSRPGSRRPRPLPPPRRGGRRPCTPR